MTHRLAASAIIVALGALLSCSRGGPRRLPDSGFHAEFGPHNIAAVMTSGKPASAEITVKNISPVTWPSKSDARDRYAVRLSYHWFDRNGQTVVFDGLRTLLPRDLKAGETVRLNAAIQAPERAGSYSLEVTLVQEAVAWFPERDGGKLVLPIKVVDGADTTAEARSAATGPPVQQKFARTPKKAGAPGETNQHVAKPAVKKLRRGGVADDLATPSRSVQTGGGSWSVQVASYAQEKIAVRLVEKLVEKGYDAYVMAFKINGKQWYRVRVGRSKSRAEAEKLRDTLSRAEKLERAMITAR